MKDVTEQLLEKLRTEFAQKVSSSTLIKSVEDKIANGIASFDDLSQYALEVGKMLSQTYAENVSSSILPGGKMPFEMTQHIITPTMKNNFDMISGAGKKVQTDLNHAAGIGLKGIAPPLNQDRIDGIVNRVAREDNFDDVAWILNEPIVNFSQSIVDDLVKVNAEFHFKSGLSPKIVRTSTGKCCDWCDSLVGTYDYEDVRNTGNDVFRRHRKCTCKVEYDPRTGKRQDVHTKKWIDLEKDAKIEARKKVGAPEHDFKFAKPEDFDKMQAQSNMWHNELSFDQKKAVENYTDDGHEEINRHLREGASDARLDETIKHLDSALAEYRLDEDRKFYRGIGSEELKAIENGGIIPDYKSLTTEKCVAQIFLDMGNAQNGEIVVFNVPKGMRGAYIGDNSANPGENEFLLGRKAKTTTRRVNGVLEVTVNED